MLTLLLIIIYIAFIGLGLPDALLGSAWSVMKSDIGATTEMAGYIALTVSLCTVISSLFASRLLHKFGTGKVTLFSILSTTLALLGFSFSNHFAFLILLAIPLGFGAGSVDAALSNYMALHFKAKHMNWLHCCFFIGIIIGRVFSGFLSTQVSSKNLIRYGGLMGCLGLFILVLPVSYWVAAGALFIVGLGGAPIYPSIVHATPVRFGEKASSSVIGLEMASAYAGSTLIPLLMGLIASQFGMLMVPIILLLLFGIMFAASEMVNRSYKLKSV